MSTSAGSTRSPGKSDMKSGGKRLSTTPYKVREGEACPENAVLVDIGDKHPLFDDYMVDITSTSSPEELRLCTQISLIGYLVPCSGEVLVLQTSWNQAGIAANHKELF